MRTCPVCTHINTIPMWSMPFQPPDGWPLPHYIDWYKCLYCGMLYGDGDFDQQTYNEYYIKYYGYGINSIDVVERLQGVADEIASRFPPSIRFCDFGGSGDDGKSIACERLISLGYHHVHNVNAGEVVPTCDVLLASHVLEHVYDMYEVMQQINEALVMDGLLIVDGPDATGIALNWGMPMLDFHTKHINHFRMIDYLNLMQRWGFELVDSVRYVDVRSNQTANCLRMYFQRINTAAISKAHIHEHISGKLIQLREIDYPVNVWGLGDITWHVLAQSDLDVLDYIDNDPAMVGHTYQGKPIVQAPTNGAPIVIMAQGQRSNLLRKIQSLNIGNEVIEI